MKTSFAAALLVALAGCSTDAQSDRPAAAAVDTTNVEAAADAYLAAYPVAALMEDMSEAMTEQAPPEARAQLRAALGAVEADTLETAMRRSMVRHFSAAELRALAAFYGSPAGRSVMDKMPAYMADVMPVVQQEVLRAMGETMQATP